MSEFATHPRDNTVWDPFDPEHAIEDPLHGSEAIISLLETPPMPLRNGSYWVFGASSFVRTCTFDKDGKPFIAFGHGSIAAELHRFSHLVEDWNRAVEDGDLPDDYPKNPAEFFDFTATPYFTIDK